jgi:hypothetical protein
MWDQVVQYIFQIHDALYEALNFIEVPKDVKSIFAFTEKSFASLRSDFKWLGRVKLTNNSGLDLITSTVIRLTWLVLCLGRTINEARIRAGKKRIDFIKEATEYDKEIASSDRIS